ncbi:MAG: sulfite exporter TauE/SafE family protein [Clostridia bacterium]|nr:sulfite exporter TauE/SafE family protein [Clostridia bacterium]
MSMAVNMIAAFLIALLSGLGVGGGGLFTVYLVVLADMPQLAAQGINLLFFLFSSGASVTVQLFRGRIFFGAVGVMIAAGTVGVLLGALAAGALPEHWLRRVFGIMLVSGGILSLRSSMKEKYAKNLSTPRDENGQNTTDKGE